MVRITFDSREKVLDHQRHTPERTVGQRGARIFAGPIEARMDHRVELGIQLLDARDRVVDQLQRRGLAGANELGLRGRIEERVGHVRLPW